MRENVCVCLDAVWCMVSTFKRLGLVQTSNRLDLFMNRKSSNGDRVDVYQLL